MFIIVICLRLRFYHLFSCCHATCIHDSFTTLVKKTSKTLVWFYVVLFKTINKIVTKLSRRAYGYSSEHNSLGVTRHSILFQFILYSQFFIYFSLNNLFAFTYNQATQLIFISYSCSFVHHISKQQFLRPRNELFILQHAILLRSVPS
jgi:hypothetical protein